MSRLAPLDKALVLILVPIWVICFALGVRTAIQGGAEHPLLGLSVEGADRYPALTGQFAFIGDSSLAQSGLRPGDRLVRVGDADLRGVGTLGFAWRSLEEAGREHNVLVVFERDGERLETFLGLNSRGAARRPLLAAAFALAASALFLLLRAQPTSTVRAYFYLAMCWALTTPFHENRWEFYAWLGLFVAASSLLLPLAFQFVFRFPDDLAPEGRWHRIWPWFFAVNGLFVSLAEGLFAGPAKHLFAGLGISSGMAVGFSGFAITTSLGAMLILAVATRKYRRADLVGRRQMKWVLCGVYCVVLPLEVTVALIVLYPRFGWLWFPSFWVVLLLPLSLVISVVRFNLFDIDRILSATASYNILAVLLGAGALIVVPSLAEGVSDLVGVDRGTGQIALSLVLASVLIPAHRRLRPQIDRLF